METKAFTAWWKSLTSLLESDLANASTIHQVNQQTRAFNKKPDDRLTLKETEESAGFLRNEKDSE